jgi:hypothetical protein
MLLRLAGNAPDDLVTRCRGWLAEDYRAEFAQALAGAAASGQVRLSDDDADLLYELLTEANLSTAELDDVPTIASGYHFTHAFAAGRSGTPAEATNGGDTAAIEAAQAQGSALALWRSWRTKTDGRSPREARPVYVIETDLDADLPAVTGAVQAALQDAGEIDPQVETYPIHADLPQYQRQARGASTLLWTRDPAPEMRMAVLFDGVDPQTGPFMRPDHPTVDDDAERAGLIHYLGNGRPLLVTTALMDDVVDPARGRRVPMSFRTDGHWIWTDATTYYLAEHRMLPDPDLAEHIRSCEFEMADVDGAGMHRAMAKLTEPTSGEPAWTYR